MDRKFFKYLRFRPSENPDKGLISEASKWPLDYIFTPNASQEELYTKFKYLTDDMHRNKNGCLIVIGNYESGRRYSIFGRFPTHNGIITKITEEVIQAEDEYKIILTVTDINGRSLIPPKKTAENKQINRFETNLLEISQGITAEAFNIEYILFKLMIKETASGKENFVNIVQLDNSEENLQALHHLIHNTSYHNSQSKLFTTLQSITSLSEKVSILLTCKESKQDSAKLKQIFFPLESKSVQEPTKEAELLNNKIKDLEEEVKRLKLALSESERRCHEYYESYHRTLLLINKDTAQNVFLNSQNESLIRQIRKETSLVQALEAKYQNLIDTCAKSHESTHIEFDSCLDSFIKSDSSVELNATDTLNLGISQVRLALEPDTFINSPYSSELRQALEGNSELNKEVKILQLKNQLIEASVINANMSRMLSSFDWKFSMLKHRYDMKRLLTKQQQERIKSLEEMIEFLHESFENLKRGPSTAGKDLDKLFEKYCYKAIVDSQRLVAESKKNMQDVEKKATEAYKRESQKWMDLLSEHKENYERELLRKQSEVIRLNELLGKWVNKYMELQENMNSDKPLSIMYYSQIQELIRETINSPFEKTKEKHLTPKAKSTSISQKFSMNSGDVYSPLA